MSESGTRSAEISQRENICTSLSLSWSRREKKVLIMHTTDIDIELQLRAMFMVMRLPSLEKITVKVEDSLVELGGSVLTHFEKNVCEDCCRRIEGVLSIHNNIYIEKVHVPQ